MFNIDEQDRITFMTMSKLIKRYNGEFQTAGQWFHSMRDAESPEGYDGFAEWVQFAAANYGVSFDKTDGSQRLVTVSATLQWSELGGRSLVPLIFAFIIDDYGVVRKYKIGGRGNLRDGWSPDPAKCKLQWERGELSETAQDFRKLDTERKNKKEEEKADLLEFTEGRQEINGVIVSFKTYTNEFGISMKMLVKLDDGRKVFGTLPNAIYEAEEGDRVKFTARITPVERGFAVYGRPTKASIVEKKEEETA